MDSSGWGPPRGKWVEEQSGGWLRAEAEFVKREHLCPVRTEERAVTELLSVLECDTNMCDTNATNRKETGLS